MASTSNTIRMPVSMCSAIWQCSIHLPGFGNSSRTSVTKPVGTSTVSFHTRCVVRHAVDRQHQEPLAVDVDRVLHRVQRRCGRSPGAASRHRPRGTASAMSMFSRPVARSRRIHCARSAGGDPVHLRHRAAPLDRMRDRPIRNCISGRSGNGRSPASSVMTSSWSTGRSKLRAGSDRSRRPRSAFRRSSLERSPHDRARPAPRDTCTTPSVCVSSKKRARMWSMARTRLTSDTSPGSLEADVDHVALGRRDGDVVDPGFPLVAAEIRRHDLHAPRPARLLSNDTLKTRVLETLVRKSRTTSPRRARVVPARLAVDEQHVAEAPHQRMGRRLEAIPDRPAVSHEQVVEHQHLFAVGRARRSADRASGRADCRRGRGPAGCLRDGAGDTSRCRHRGSGRGSRTTPPGGNGILRDVRDAVEPIVEPHAVPVHGRREVGAVHEPHDDRRAPRPPG